MRLFTAIDLPAETKAALAALLDRFRPLARLRWSPIENLHITTKFIGEWPEAKLDDMKRALAQVTAPAIEVAVRGLGWFPNADRPRVLWAGIEGGDALRKLARDTERAVAKHGVTVEVREYSPHLTLARIPDPRDIAGEGAPLRKAIAETGAPDFGSFRASAFHLYLSAGGKYTKLVEYPL
jgi:2'-5' RNA ligase